MGFVIILLWLINYLLISKKISSKIYKPPQSSSLCRKKKKDEDAEATIVQSIQQVQDRE